MSDIEKKASKTYVISGKALVTLNGILAPGAEVSADMLKKGKETFDNLVAAKRIVKGK